MVLGSLDMNYVIDKSKTVSGFSEARSKIFKKIKVKNSDKTYLVAVQPNEADNIYVGYPYDTKSQGFGGAWIEFKIEDGLTIKLQGPWHTNADDLFKETGYDIRDKYLTFVVISKDSKLIDYNDVMIDVLYIDDKPQIGHFYRGREIAEKLSKELGIKVWLYSKSHSGSSIRTIEC